MIKKINIFVELLNMLEDVVFAEVFETKEEYRNIKKQRYIPYIEKLIEEYDFSYKSYSSFTIHYYNLSPIIHVCIVGRFLENINEVIHKLFISLKRPDESALESSLLDWIFTSIPEVIAFKDTEGYFRYATKDSIDLYPRIDTIIGKHYKEIYSDKAVKEIEFFDNEAYQQKSKVKRIINIETDFGWKTYESTRTPIYDTLNNPLGMISINRDITESNQLRTQFDMISSIQETLIDVANSFIDLSHEKFDDVVNKSLKKIGEVIDADRCYIFKYFFEENKMTNTYEWCNNGIEPEIENLQNQPIVDYLTDWVRLHRNKENVIIEDVSQLDKETPLYEVLSSQDIKSLITMPIFLDDKCFGFIGFDSVQRHRSWHDIPTLLKILPSLFGNLFSRYELYKMLVEANEENRRLNHQNMITLSTVQAQIRRPLKEIKEILNNKQNERLQYQVDLIESITENMAYVNESISEDKSSFTDLSLEELLIRITENNKKFATHKNNHLYFDYDYQINSRIRSDESKLTIIIDTIMKHLIENFNGNHITLSAHLVREHDPYQEIKISIKIDSKISTSKSNVSLSPLKTITNTLGTKLDIKANDTYSDISFTIPFFVPKRSKNIKDLSNVIGFIDLTTGISSNAFCQIQSLYQNVIKIDPLSIQDTLNEAYDIIIVHTNNADYYSSQIGNLIIHFENIPRILLYENHFSMVYDNSFLFYNKIYSIPVLTQLLITESLIKGKSMPANNTESIPSVLIVDGKNETYNLISSCYKKSEINTYRAINSKKLNTSDFDQLKIIFIDEYLPLENGLDVVEVIQQIEKYNNVAIYLMSTGLNTVNNDTLKKLNCKLLQKPLIKSTIKNIISHHIYNNPVQVEDLKANTKLFNYDQFKLLYPKIENQNSMKAIILAKLKAISKQLESKEISNYQDIQTSIRDIALQAQTDRLQSLNNTTLLSADTVDELNNLIKRTIIEIKKRL